MAGPVHCFEQDLSVRGIASLGSRSSQIRTLTITVRLTDTREVVLEITERPHTGCAKFSKRFRAEALRFVNSPEGRRLRLRGVHAQVIAAGWIKVGDRIEKV